jgi:hypothetical protein
MMIYTVIILQNLEEMKMPPKWKITEAVGLLLFLAPFILGALVFIFTWVAWFWSWEENNVAVVRVSLTTVALWPISWLCALQAWYILTAASVYYGAEWRRYPTLIDSILTITTSVVVTISVARAYLEGGATLVGSSVFWFPLITSVFLGIEIFALVVWLTDRFSD